MLFFILLFLQGNVTFSCSQPQLVACTFVSASSSFLTLPSHAPAAGDFSVRFQFRTWNPDGLLLSVQLDPSPQKLELQISNSWLLLTLHGAGGQRTEVSAGEFQQAFSALPQSKGCIRAIKTYLFLS